MSKATPSKLDQHAERLIEWFTDNKTLAFARDELDKVGLQVSLSQLSRWWARWQERQEREKTDDLMNDWAEAMEAELKKFNPNADTDQIRQFAIAHLIKKGLATSQDKLALAAIDRQQTEISGRTRAEQKDRELKIAQTRLLMESDDFLAKVLAKAEEMSQSGLSNAEKIASLRQIYFADVEALQRSGSVQLPS